jgi:hypothetical protein
MKKLQVKFVRSYTSRKGNKTFVYVVTGKAEDLAEYKALQGDNYREDEQGNPLWFTTRFAGTNVDLIITTNKKIVPDMSEYDQAASLAEQFGGNLGEAIAKAAAEKLIGNMGRQLSANVSAPAEKKVEDLSQV